MADGFSSLDRQINELYDCKPLTESEVEALCDKVRPAVCRVLRPAVCRVLPPTYESRAR